MGPRILVIDEDPQIAALLETMLKREGATVVVEKDAARGVTLLATEPIDMLFTSALAQGPNELEVLRIARQRRPHLPVIVVAAVGSVDSTVDAFRLGAVDYLTMPLQPECLSQALARAAAKSTQMQFPRPPVSPFNGVVRNNPSMMVATSPSIKHLAGVCARIASSALPILVTGETGVGKQTLVRLIHSLSAQPNSPFVKVNCDAMQESQLREMFFGREDALDGKIVTRIGLIEQAAGGTLFLRNITGLPRWMQKEVLQAAQARVFCRQDGIDPVSFRARVAASTVQPPADSVKHGVLLQDLHCYLSAIPLDIPALRYRREDIRPLVKMLTSRFAAEVSPGGPSPTRRFSEGALDLLEAYDWPGNIHELSNLIRRMLVFVSETEILAAHVNEHLIPPTLPREMNTITVPFVGDLKLIERSIVAEVISRAHGNKSAAARSLGLHRKTLYRIIENNTNGRAKLGGN